VSHVLAFKARAPVTPHTMQKWLRDDRNMVVKQPLPVWLPSCGGSIWAWRRPSDQRPLATVTCHSPLTSPAQQSTATTWNQIPGSSSQACL